jgi:hypothetical protein
LQPFKKFYPMQIDTGFNDFILSGDLLTSITHRMKKFTNGSFKRNIWLVDACFWHFSMLQKRLVSTFVYYKFDFFRQIKNHMTAGSKCDFIITNAVLKYLLAEVKFISVKKISSSCRTSSLEHFELLSHLFCVCKSNRQNMIMR